MEEQNPSSLLSFSSFLSSSPPQSPYLFSIFSLFSFNISLPLPLFTSLHPHLSLSASFLPPLTLLLPLNIPLYLHPPSLSLLPPFVFYSFPLSLTLTFFTLFLFLLPFLPQSLSLPTPLYLILCRFQRPHRLHAELPC